MNLSEVKLKLFRVKSNNITVYDAFGIHIGDNTPTSNIRNMREILYVAGESMDQVIKYLFINKIHATQIVEMGILLDAT